MVLRAVSSAAIALGWLKTRYNSELLCRSISFKGVCRDVIWSRWMRRALFVVVDKSGKCAWLCEGDHKFWWEGQRGEIRFQPKLQM